MQLNQLKPRHKNYKSASIGRGGKRGKTSGRGTKGQKARAGHKIRPEARDMIKKIPKLRGRGKNIFTSVKIKPAVINLKNIAKLFTTGAEISPSILLDKKLIRRMGGVIPKVKVLGDGEITFAVTISGCEVSASAKSKIEKVGGKVIE